MSIIFDTPQSVAFFRALARQGAATIGKPGIVKTLKDVYGYTGSPKAVKAMHDDFIASTLEVRSWTPEHAFWIGTIAQGALDRAEKEYPDDPRLKDHADRNVQDLFSDGAITEQEGNDACTLIFVEVVRQRAGSR